MRTLFLLTFKRAASLISGDILWRSMLSLYRRCIVCTQGRANGGMSEGVKGRNGQSTDATRSFRNHEGEGVVQCVEGNNNHLPQRSSFCSHPYRSTKSIMVSECAREGTRAVVSSGARRDGEAGRSRRLRWNRMGEVANPQREDRLSYLSSWPHCAAAGKL